MTLAWALHESKRRRSARSNVSAEHAQTPSCPPPNLLAEFSVLTSSQLLPMVYAADAGKWVCSAPVSYTHLTLPTICSV
eukprot:4618624-Prorocentrum_lima.AAC.1